jgi:putrescine:ornithine antiporter
MIPSRLAAGLALLSAALAQPALAQMIQVPKGAAVGYYTDARPLSFDNESGRPSGYAVELCQAVAGAQIEWVAVTAQSRRAALRDGKVKLLCGEAVTLSAQKELAFSIPIFQGGLGAMLRADAAAPLKQALSSTPGTSGQTLLQQQAHAVIGGAPAEKALADWFASLNLPAQIVRVPNEAAGAQAVLERKVAVFFAERSILLDTWRRNPSSGDLTVLARRFTVAPIAIALRRGDDDARLAIDRALSRFYASKEFRSTYAKWFGRPDADAAAFFRLNMLPE